MGDLIRYPQMAAGKRPLKPTVYRRPTSASLPDWVKFGTLWRVTGGREYGTAWPSILMRATPSRRNRVKLGGIRRVAR